MTELSGILKVYFNEWRLLTLNNKFIFGNKSLLFVLSTILTLNKTQTTSVFSWSRSSQRKYNGSCNKKEWTNYTFKIQFQQFTSPAVEKIHYLEYL